MATHSGAPVRRTERFVWTENSQDTALRLSTVEVSADGLHTWSTVWNGAQAVVTRTDIS